MRENVIGSVFLCVLASSQAYGQITSIRDDKAREQMNRLIEGVHNRVNDAAQAATYILKSDRHRHQAERMAAAGQQEEARAELQLAAEVIAAADAAIQADLLIHDYAAELQQAIAALDSAQEHQVGDPDPKQAKIHFDLSFIEGVLKANSLPTQLTAVVMVESAGDPMALSPKGARGLWQLMPDTARRYGLRVDDRVDERVDPVQSTYAATRYLAELYEMFKDWSLALAAYNTGENRIQRVMERTGIQRFSEMANRRLLSAETIQYVPAVLNAMRRAATSSPEFE